MPDFHLRRALLPTGWRDDVRVEVNEAGRIARVDVRGDDAGAHRLGFVVPGLPNLHSHTFQRAMAGLTERGGPGEDSFWSWREVMYDFVDRLTPDQVQAIAALAFCEMLESGFTTVAEFHYLHHAPDGRPYDDPAEMSARIAAAAHSTGIPLTLLPVFYRHGGFGPTPATDGQRRFLHDLDGYARLIERCGKIVASSPDAVLGVAPHSLRAATVEEIGELARLLEGAPVHIHVAEQEAEVEACLDILGARPVRHLLDSVEIDERWCLIHATHMDEGEIAELAGSGAVAGLCPVTEANLGDGIFPAPDFLAAGGAIGVGSDSNIRIDPADELRTLEYGQRLTRRRRNVLAGEGESSGGRLYRAALHGGARATGQPVGGIEVGARADFVELNDGSPLFIGREGDAVLDSWIFGGGPECVGEVWVGGRRVVEGGRALARAFVERDYRAAVGELRP